jgi:hypothetical protein
VRESSFPSSSSVSINEFLFMMFQFVLMADEQSKIFVFSVSQQPLSRMFFEE